MRKTSSQLQRIFLQTRAANFSVFDKHQVKKYGIRGNTRVIPQVHKIAAALENPEKDSIPKPEYVAPPLHTKPVEISSAGVFANDSTPLLIKKLMVYKLMGSDLFINHSLTLVNMSYKLFGIKLTNFAVNNSVASLFTSGETLTSYMKDQSAFSQQNIGTVGMSVVEGMPHQDNEYVAKIYGDLMEYINVTTRGGQASHLAIKFTAIISTDVMTKMSRAQHTFMNDILLFDK